MEVLEDAMVMMTQEGFSILSPFLHDLLVDDERAKYASLLLDLVVKYYGPARATDTLRAALCRMHADLPSKSSDDNELFDAEFLSSMLIRFGTKNFLRLFVMPLIEKLADIQPVAVVLAETEVLELLEEQPIFPLEEEDVQDQTVERASLLSMTEVDTVQTRIISALVWLAEDLGPVLCARYITGNLLKSLSLCYVDPDGLSPTSRSNMVSSSTLFFQLDWKRSFLNTWKQCLFIGI